MLSRHDPGETGTAMTSSQELLQIQGASRHPLGGNQTAGAHPSPGRGPSLPHAASRKAALLRLKGYFRLYVFLFRALELGQKYAARNETWHRIL